jgi:AcrR family transcriptional regulator
MFCNGVALGPWYGNAMGLRGQGVGAGGSGFSRARTPEQKESRRAAILAAARGLVAERGVHDVTLGDLADAVGLAKSNVVRYFGTREEIFVELATSDVEVVTCEVVAALAALPPDADDPAMAVATALTGVLDRHPVFLDVVAHLPSHLEHNVSLATAVLLKQRMHASAGVLAAAVRDACPDLTEGDAALFVTTLFLVVPAAWEAGRPAPVVREVYATHPELAADHDALTTQVRGVLAATLRGLHVASGSPV